MLEGDEVILIGGMDFRVINTPGHSPGGISLYCRAENILICGDTIFKSGVGRTDFPGCNREKLKQAIESRLLSLPGETKVLPGHGEDTTIKEFKVNTWENMF